MNVLAGRASNFSGFFLLWNGAGLLYEVSIYESKACFCNQSIVFFCPHGRTCKHGEPFEAPPETLSYIFNILMLPTKYVKNILKHTLGSEE